MMCEKEIYEAAVKTFGPAQVLKAIEELNELSAALVRLHCACESGVAAAPIDTLRENIFEEIADVLIVVQQLYIIFNCKAKVDQWKEKKLDWLAFMLETTKGGKS